MPEASELMLSAPWSIVTDHVIFWVVLHPVADVNVIAIKFWCTSYKKMKRDASAYDISCQSITGAT